jgi:hypothetical protein
VATPFIPPNTLQLGPLAAQSLVGGTGGGHVQLTGWQGQASYLVLWKNTGTVYLSTRAAPGATDADDEREFVGKGEVYVGYYDRLSIRIPEGTVVTLEFTPTPVARVLEPGPPNPRCGP